MAIKNLSLQTIALHIGYKDYSKLSDISAIYNKAGYLTNPGISIFGDAVAGQKATVTIYPPNSESKQSYLPSLYVKGDSAFIGDIAVNGSQTITKDLTISGTMKAGFATWSSSIVATTKLFDIKHPSREGHRLAHASLEGPEVGVYCRGRLKESNVINLPEYWKDLVHEDSITVQLQPIGSNQNLVIQEFNNEFIVIAEDSTNTDFITDLSTIDCFYHVYGERKDVERLTVEYESDTILEQGKPK